MAYRNADGELVDENGVPLWAWRDPTNPNQGVYNAGQN